MILFKKEMEKYNKEELKNLGRGMYLNNYDNYAIKPSLLLDMRKLSTKITGDVFAYPENVDNFELTEEQIYYRGKIFTEIMNLIIQERTWT